MRIRLSKNYLALIALGMMLGACSPSDTVSEEAADTIYHGGDIVTVNNAQ